MSFINTTSVAKIDPQSDIVLDKDWWRGAVIYQIYPRSFQDSNGDGIGDLAGIILRLEYVKSLGVDAIWISPFFTSPMADFGYDVSNYKDVDPMFGDLAEFDRLVKKAHELGLKIMIDLVISHSSSEHPWFIKSRENKTNSKSDWYVWADAKDDGSPPNNWLSIFGGPAWQWDSGRCQYYMHNFLSSQPDLNFHNLDVQDALLDICRFWLDRGVDGFRLDTINFYFCDKELRDNPPLPIEQRNANIAPKVNPYNYQDHIYDKNRPENIDFLKRLRSVMDEYPAIAAVGEVGDAQYGMQLMAQYTKGDDLMHMCYAFEFLSSDPFNKQHVIDVLEKYETIGADGWACWAFSNHDVVRHASRWELDEKGQKLAATLLMSLRGSVCLYQGEELGFSEADVAFEDLQDPYGVQFWPKFKGRDGCRTPMVWNSNELNGGFSNAKPWLPIAKEHLEKAVVEQEKKNLSLLAHYKNLISFRKTYPALIKGDLELVYSNIDVVSFIRNFEEEIIFCAFNMGQSEACLSLPKGEWKMLKGLDTSASLSGEEISLPAGQAFFAAKIGRENG